MANCSVKLGSAAVIVAAGIASAASAQGWTGAYVGGAVGASGGEFSQSAPYGNFDGANGQLFAGYIYQMGNLTLGGEVATFLGNTTSSNPNVYLRNLTDLKLRFGTTFGSALVYASAGYSFGGSNSFGVDFDFSGVNYGLGMDYAVNDRVFVGADIVARNIDDGGNYLDARPMTTASIRAGFRF